MKKHVFALAIAALGLTAVAAPQPVLQFNFNEGTGDVVASTGSIPDVTLKIKNERLKWVDGRDGSKALFFDNPRDGVRNNLGCLTLNMDKHIDFTKPFSVTAWVMVAPDTLKNRQFTILSNVKSDYGPGWRLIYSWGSFVLATGQGTAKTNDGISINQAKFPHKVGEWHHLAIVYDGTNAAIFLNGIKANEKAMTISKGNSTFTFGAYVSGSAYGFPGALSNVKFFNAPLTPEDVLLDAKGIK